jgi:hypothetical protein
MNRADRRAARASWRAQADQIAAICARACIDIGKVGQGPHRPVDHPLAIRAIERAFAHLLRQGGEPHVMRLSAEEAAALAPWDPPRPAGWSHFIAVGIDRVGRASYVSRPVRVEGASAIEARRLIEARLLAELRPILEDTSPVPIREALSTPGGAGSPLPGWGPSSGGGIAR